MVCVVWALWWPFDLFRVCSCLSAVNGCSPPRLSKIFGQIKIETSLFYHFINISAKLICTWPFSELQRHQNKGKKKIGLNGGKETDNLNKKKLAFLFKRVQVGKPFEES